MYVVTPTSEGKSSATVTFLFLCDGLSAWVGIADSGGEVGTDTGGEIATETGGEVGKETGGDLARQFGGFFGRPPSFAFGQVVHFELVRQLPCNLVGSASQLYACIIYICNLFGQSQKNQDPVLLLSSNTYDGLVLIKVSEGWILPLLDPQLSSMLQTYFC